MLVDLERISSRTILVGALVAGLALVGLAIGLSLWLWPVDSKPDEQATLAGALLTFAGLIAGWVWKAIFDELSGVASHRRDLRGKLLERFMAIRSAYYSQLIGVAGELAATLAACAEGPAPREHLESAFYHTARYVELVAVLRARFQRLAPSDYPPGLILRSGEAENQVWGLMLEPWVFGLWTLRERSSVLTSIRDADGKLVSPENFLEALSRNRNLHTAWEDFKDVMGRPSNPRVISQILYLFNAVLDYEAGRVIDAWYGRAAPYPQDRVEEAHDVLREAGMSPSELGIELPPSHKPA